MNSWRVPTRRLLLEELEGRLVPSTSTNWSGYAVLASSGSVTFVTGTWKVPTVTGPSTGGYAASWVGIDGDGSNTVEQLGTESDFINGHATYYAWYEMYPQASKNITTMTVAPGDSITGTVSWSSAGPKGGTYTLSLTDTSRAGDSFSIAIPSNKTLQRSSAEWVVEAPSQGGILPLASYGSETFSGAQVGLNGGAATAVDHAAGTTIDEITMANGQAQSVPGSLSDTGTTSSAFTLTYQGPGSTSTGTGTGTGTGSGSGSGHHHGGGGWWGWWFSPEQTVDVTSQMAAAAALAAGSPRSVATAFTATPGAASALPPATTLVTPAASSAGLAALAGGGGTRVTLPAPAAQDAAMPEVPPDGGVQPGTPAPPKTDGQPDAAPMPPAAPDAAAAADTTLACDALFSDGRWSPVAPGDGASTSLAQNDDDAGGLPSIAGMLFTLSLGGVWGITREQAAERRRRQGLR